MAFFDRKVSAVPLTYFQRLSTSDEKGREGKVTTSSCNMHTLRWACVIQPRNEYSDVTRIGGVFYMACLLCCCFCRIRIPDGNGEGTGTAADFGKGKDGNGMVQILHTKSSLPGRFGDNSTLPFFSDSPLSIIENFNALVA